MWGEQRPEEVSLSLDWRWGAGQHHAVPTRKLDSKSHATAVAFKKQIAGRLGATTREHKFDLRNLHRSNTSCMRSGTNAGPCRFRYSLTPPASMDSIARQTANRWSRLAVTPVTAANMEAAHSRASEERQCLLPHSPGADSSVSYPLDPQGSSCGHGLPRRTRTNLHSVNSVCWPTFFASA